MSADLEFQTLLAQEIGAAVTCDVDAHPAHDRALPYVQIGESDSEDWVAGQELRADVHVWSSTEGPHETKTLQALIRGALHASTHSLGGFTFSCCRETDCRVFRDVDDETWHGVQTFHCFVT